jgi:hypothetical protein
MKEAKREVPLTIEYADLVQFVKPVLPLKTGPRQKCDKFGTWQ